LRTTNYQAPQALHTHLIKNNKKILIKAAMARKFFNNDYIDAQHHKPIHPDMSDTKKANLSVFNMNERIMSDYFIKPINDQLKSGQLSTSLRNSLGSRNILNPSNIAKTMNEITRMQSTSRSESEEGGNETQMLQSLKNEILKN
jgi:hypothetical protein